MRIGSLNDSSTIRPARDQGASAREDRQPDVAALVLVATGVVHDHASDPFDLRRQGEDAAPVGCPHRPPWSITITSPGVAASTAAVPR